MPVAFSHHASVIFLRCACYSAAVSPAGPLSCSAALGPVPRGAPLPPPAERAGAGATAAAPALPPRLASGGAGSPRRHGERCGPSAPPLSVPGRGCACCRSLPVKSRLPPPRNPAPPPPPWSPGSSPASWCECRGGGMRRALSGLGRSGEPLRGAAAAPGGAAGFGRGARKGCGAGAASRSPAAASRRVRAGRRGPRAAPWQGAGEREPPRAEAAGVRGAAGP